LGISILLYKNKVRQLALKVTTNIDVLIKDLFHNPPSYKSTVTLSWKQLEVIRFVRLILAGNARFFKI